MRIEVIQTEYDGLDAIAGRFAKHAESTVDMRSRIENDVHALQNGKWEGLAATAFFTEMDRDVFPVMTRLTAALEQAPSITLQVKEILQAAEEEAARPFGFAGIEKTLTGAAKALPSKPPPQNDLEKLTTALEHQCINPDLILEAIAKATPAERQAILNSPQLMAYIKNSEGIYADVITAALLEDSLNWPGPSGPNPHDNYRIAPNSDFARWIRGEVPAPDSSTGSMNCWESIMYSAYLSGEISHGELVSIHERAAKAKTGYYDVIENSLGADDAKSWQTGNTPPGGSIIFFHRNGSPLSHVAIATGRTTPDGEAEIMSLWTLPADANGNQVRSMQRTTIEDMRKAMEDIGYAPDDITYAPNPWDN